MYTGYLLLRYIDTEREMRNSCSPFKEQETSFPFRLDIMVFCDYDLLNIVGF
jgi:hypothetical protein